MKITQKIDAGLVKSFWVSYNGNWEFTTTDGSEVTIETNEEILRSICETLVKKVAELDKELLEAAKAKVVENLEAEVDPEDRDEVDVDM